MFLSAPLMGACTPPWLCHQLTVLLCFLDCKLGQKISNALAALRSHNLEKLGRGCPSKLLPLSSSLSGNRSGALTIVWIFFFFLQLCVHLCVCVCACARVKKNRFCPGGNGEEGRRELHFQGQRLGSRFPEVTQTHHSDNSHCNFIFIPLEK